MGNTCKSGEIFIKKINNFSVIKFAAYVKVQLLCNQYTDDRFTLHI